MQVGNDVCVSRSAWEPKDKLIIWTGLTDQFSVGTWPTFAGVSTLAITSWTMMCICDAWNIPTQTLDQTDDWIPVDQVRRHRFSIKTDGRSTNL